MDLYQFKQHLTDLVLDGREDVAIEELIAISNSKNQETRKTITELSSIYQKFEKAKTKGALTREDITNTDNRISQAILSMIDHLTDDDKDGMPDIDLKDLLDDNKELFGLIKVASKRSRIIKSMAVIVPIFLVVMVAILMFSKSSTPSKYNREYLDGWTGNWKYRMQATGNSEITGNISFELSDGNFIGETSDVFPEGSRTSTTLSDIVFEENGKAIKGNWKNENIQSLNGSFKFKLEENNQFTGIYTVLNQDGTFYWNGER